jgi:hypothetical protein
LALWKFTSYSGISFKQLRCLFSPIQHFSKSHNQLGISSLSQKTLCFSVLRVSNEQELTVCRICSTKNQYTTLWFMYGALPVVFMFIRVGGCSCWLTAELFPFLFSLEWPHVYVGSPSLLQPFSLPSLGAGFLKRHMLFFLCWKLWWNIPVEVVALSFCYTKPSLMNNIAQ